PDPVLVGGTLIYSLSVTNKGPSLASGVVVSNVLPSSVGIVAVNPSQGFYNIYGNVVVCSFGNLVNGARATATIGVVPNLEGTISAPASATANQPDPVPANSSATASTVVGPASDLALGLVDAPDPVVVSSNLTYTINITNRGPSVATSVVV